VRAISCHPEEDAIFLSASEDGCIILHDTRADSRLTRAQGTLQHDAEFTGVQFHPNMHHIFATSDNRGQLCLRDCRMAFGPLSQRRQNGVVQTYITTLSKPSIQHLSNPEVSSITFDATGTKLAATMLHYFPTIYSLADPYPLAICSGRRQRDGEPFPKGQGSYTNSCTIKHGSFGSGGLDDDQYYCAGSDDFRAYVWKIPDNAVLLEQRTKIDADAWTNVEDSETIGSSQSRL